MTYTVKIEAAGGSAAEQAIAGVEAGLTKAGAAADRARDANGRWAASGSAAGKATAEAMNLITASAEMANMDLAKLNALLGIAATSTKTVGDAAADTGRSMGDWATAMEREAAILERIQGPIREYKADLDALDRMLAKGTLSQSEYTAEMDRLIKKQGTMQGPKQEFSAPAAAPAVPTANLGTNVLGIYAAGAAVMAGGAMFASIVQGMHDLEDQSIRATNAAQKFVDAGHDVSTVMREQLVVADNMHASYTTTIALYNKVREGSEGVALSHREQLQLTQTLGEAVQLSNKPVEEASSLMSKFAFAMQTGTIQSRELRNMMREVPAITDVWREKFHATNVELMDMVKIGKITIADLVASLSGSGVAVDAMHAKFGNLTRTNEQVLSQFKEQANLIAGNTGTSNLENMLNMAAPWVKMSQDLKGTVVGAIGDFVTKMDDAKAAAERLNQANLQGVAQEIEKLNDPAEKAQLELTALNKAFGQGAVDIDVYNKELLKLQTTANHGIAPEGLKINVPIDDAKKSLDSLNRAFADEEITYAQYEKRRNALETTILGALPEADKFMTPIEDARRALADLNAAKRAGTVDSEYARIESERLMTTINDGRLPETIKWWDSFHLPVEQFGRDTAALNGLLKNNAITWSEWRASMEKASATAGTSGEIWKLLQSTDDLSHIKPIKINSEANERALYDAQVKQQETQDATGEKFIEPARKYLQALEGVQVAVRDLGLTQQAATVLQREARDQYDSATISISKATAGVAQYQERLKGLTAKRDAGQLDDQSFQSSVSQLDRAAKIVEEMAQPLTTYKQAVADAKYAVDNLGLSQQNANAIMRDAKKAYEDTVDKLDPVAKLIKDIQAPTEGFADKHKLLDDALSRGGITLVQYNEQLDKQRANYLANTDAGKTFMGGIELGWLKIKAGADAFGATLAGSLLSDVDKLNSGFVDMVNGTAVDWSKMVDSMISDLEKLILKQLEVLAITEIINAFTGGGGTALTASGVTGSVVNAANSGSTASALSSAYPTPPSLRPAAPTPPPAPVYNLTVVATIEDAVVHAAMATPQGQKITAQTLRKNPGIR